MVFFNAPYNFARRLGQASAVPASAPVTVVTPPSSVTPPDATLAPSNPYDAPMSFSLAGVLVAGVVGVGLTLTVATALLRRK
jgi:hypothetical protein